MNLLLARSIVWTRGRIERGECSCFDSTVFFDTAIQPKKQLGFDSYTLTKGTALHVGMFQVLGLRSFLWKGIGIERWLVEVITLTMRWQLRSVWMEGKRC